MKTTILITGTSRGIGKALALHFLSQGVTVIGSSRKTQSELTHYPNFFSLKLDLSNSKSRATAIQQVQDNFESIDILINNAGVSWGAPIEEFPEIGWDKVMDTNVKGVFFLTQKLLPLLQARATKDNTSRIVNIGSIDGIGTPSFETYSYGPSKAAVHSLTKVLAGRLASRHIIVNAIAPGPFPTWMLSTGVGGGGDVDNTDWETVGRMNPSGRVGTPEDIAGLALYLCSRAGAFTVGEVITCDGGSLLK
mgnify:CR=1 FL=1